MTLLDADSMWELGIDEFGADGPIVVEGELLAWEPSPDFGATVPRENLDAINDAIERLPGKLSTMVSKGEMSKSTQSKVIALIEEWRKFYSSVITSWYVSYDDLNLAKVKRDKIFKAAFPEDVAEQKTWTKVPTGGQSGTTGVTTREKEAYLDESKTFFERHWKPIAIGVVLVAAGAYVLVPLLTVVQLYQRGGVARRVMH